MNIGNNPLTPGLSPRVPNNQNSLVNKMRLSQHDFNKKSSKLNKNLNNNFSVI